jgi:hypothetical protein
MSTYNVINDMDIYSNDVLFKCFWSNWVEAVVVMVTLFSSSWFLFSSPKFFLNSSYCSARNCSKGDKYLFCLVL